jgi:peptide/nickel transport system ATP-binding protein
MYLGRIVETSDVDSLIDTPVHPYTRMLLDAIPRLDAPLDEAAPVDGEPADPHDPPPGCHFHPRCPSGPRARGDREPCTTRDPWDGHGERPHRALCHFPLAGAFDE